MNGSNNELLDADPFAARMAELMPQMCRAIMRREFSCVSEAGASAQQVWALEIIHAHGACPQRVLLEALQLKASTGTVFVDRLCKQGLARRSTNPDSRREVLLTLTRRGMTTLTRAAKRRMAEAQKLFSALSPAQRRKYLAFFESFLGTLKT